MIYYIIPIRNGVNLEPIQLQNSKVENGILFADDVCVGQNVDIDNYAIKFGNKVLLNNIPITKPSTNYPYYRTWLNWSDDGICKIN